MQRPREARQAQEGHNFPPHEGQHNLDIPQSAEKEAESNRARGHGPQLALREEGNEATLGGHVGSKELRHPQPGVGEQSWEQRFKSLQQELSRVKEVVKGRASDTMNTLVQQTESPFTVEVLHFPFQQNSGCHKWKHSMVSEIQSITSTLTKTKWSCMGIKTLCDAELSLSH